MPKLPKESWAINTVAQQLVSGSTEAELIVQELTIYCSAYYRGNAANKQCKIMNSLISANWTGQKLVRYWYEFCDRNIHALVANNA